MHVCVRAHTHTHSVCLAHKNLQPLNLALRALRRLKLEDDFLLDVVRFLVPLILCTYTNLQT